ncbi:MAG: hypothetical protein KIT73_06125 [Burkholderiales bacterium]|nr:hypothetical protein [Burkholderiales bacterium]
MTVPSQSTPTTRFSGGTALRLLGAVIAVGFLLWLAFGSRPVDRHFIKAEAKGALAVDPESVDAVRIDIPGRPEQRFTFDGKQWRDAVQDRDLDPAASQRLSVAVKIMKTSNPIREMGPDEIGETPLSDFGLDPPRLSIALAAGGTDRLQVDLGNVNPQSLLRYARIDKSSSVLIYSGFVGEEWEAVAGLAAPVQR